MAGIDLWQRFPSKTVRSSLVLGLLAKLTAKNIQLVDDLYKIPPSTKMEMVADVAADQPWGTYLASEEVIRGMDALGDECAPERACERAVIGL
jgi:hypothetical protein